MMNFCKVFGFLVGDKVPEDCENKTWELFIFLRTIIDIVLSPRFVKGHVLKLEYTITNFLTLYKELFGDLKYKFHNMLHFANLMKKNGPLVHFWSMRYESKHRDVRQAAISTTCKKNLLRTVCIKSQLRLAYLKISGNLDFCVSSISTKKQLSQYEKTMYFPSDIDAVVFEFKRIEHREKQYEINMIVVVEMEECALPTFAKIVNIYVKNGEVFLLLEYFTTLFFDDHCYGYKCIKNNVKNCKKAAALPDEYPAIMVQMNNSILISPKYLL